MSKFGHQVFTVVMNHVAQKGGVGSFAHVNGRSGAGAKQAQTVKAGKGDKSTTKAKVAQKK